MSCIVKFQAPGITIAQSDEAGTLVPYGEVEHGDGHRNHGWIDLRDQPERVSQIPEATRSPGLARLLRVIADPVSRIMSSACECHAFDRTQQERCGPLWQVCGFIVVMFKDAERNQDPENLLDVAARIAEGLTPTEKHHIGFEFIVEPLKHFFGRSDCHAVMLKPLGYGSTEAEAWAAFEYATNGYRGFHREAAR